MSKSDSIVLTLGEPSFYFCAEDEDHFFGWLQNAPAVKDVQGIPTGLRVTITIPIDDASLRSLIGLHARYGIPARPLRILNTPENQQWFQDPRTYWFKSVFGDGTTTEEQSDDRS